MKKNIFMSKVLSFVTMFTLILSMGILSASKVQAEESYRHIYRQDVPSTTPNDPNLPLNSSCGNGMNVVLVLDSSTSMSSGDIEKVKSAATTLAGDLMHKDNKIGVIDFNTNVVASLSPTDSISAVNTAIGNVSHASSPKFTNWDAALANAKTMVDGNDLVIIITDGNPTKSDGSLSDIKDAMVQANLIKDANNRMLAIGIDSSGAGAGYLNIGNLEKITGVGKTLSTFPSNINDINVYTGDISNIGTALDDLAGTLCGGTITITKYLNDTKTVLGGSGWSFKINDNSVANITGLSGSTSSIVIPVGATSVSVEEVLAGNETSWFKSAECKIGTGTWETATTIYTNPTDPISPKVINIPVANAQTTIECRFVNDAAGATTLTISKNGTGNGTVGGGGTYKIGTTATMTETPDSNSTFVEWSGTGCNTGTVTMDTSKPCTAIFNLTTGGITTELGGGSTGHSGGYIGGGSSSGGGQFSSGSQGYIGCAPGYKHSIITGKECPASGEVLGAAKYNFTKLIKIGSKGDEVMELQKFLNAAGYDCGTPDGVFGMKTKLAVIKFQVANGLRADGVVGRLTRVALNK